MYCCRNCGCIFEKFKMVFEPFPDRGGVWWAVCPACRLPEQFEEVRS